MRKLLLAVAFAAGVGTANGAAVQSYPMRPVRIVVGFGAGSSPDIVARLIGQRLSDRLGQQFLIENKPGAGTNIGTETVVRSAPDGYTLLLVSASAAINTTLYDRLNFNLIHDVAPVASIARVPAVMVVNPSVPAKTVPELIAYAKANPGKLNMASSGTGNFSHLSGEMFKMMAGVDMLHVPYRGSYLRDLLSGQVQVAVDTIPALIEHIRAGELRALAVSSSTRWEALPDVPIMGEFLPRYQASAWVGIGAPKNTPTEIIEELNKEINASLTDPDVKVRLAELGETVLTGSPVDFGKLITDETEKWAKVIRAANVKPE